jgi:hydrogenase-4 component E
MPRQWVVVYSITDFITIGMLLTVVAMNSLRRIETCLQAYTLNSLLLALLMAISAFYLGFTHLYLAAAFTLASKGIAIPLFLKKVVRELKITHEVEPNINTPLSLVISSVLVVVVYSSLSKGIFIAGFTENTLKVSISIILISLFIMITRKKAITQVIGLLLMENGLFLAGFSLTYGMSTIIELGVVFDVLMGVIILGVFLSQIKKAFVTVDLDKLNTLKG